MIAISATDCGKSAHLSVDVKGGLPGRLFNVWCFCKDVAGNKEMVPCVSGFARQYRREFFYWVEKSRLKLVFFVSSDFIMHRFRKNWE